MPIDVRSVASKAVDAETIENLIANKVHENDELDFKEDWPDRPREWCKDISAMANAKGGVIICGISDVDGCADEIKGVADADKQIVRWTEAVTANIRPSILLHSQRLRMADNKEVVLFATPRSRYGPHMSCAEGQRHVYKRHSNGVNAMTIDELRSAFLHSRFEEDVVLERHRQHVQSIPVATSEYVVCIDALPLPLDIERFDVSDDLRREVQRHFAGIWGIMPCRIAFDGFSLGAPPLSHARVMRSGWIKIAHTDTDRIDERVFATGYFVPRLHHAMAQIRACLDCLGIGAPWYICMTIAGMRGRLFCSHMHYEDHERNEVDLDCLEFKPLLYDDEWAKRTVDEFIHEWLDRLWQAGGFTRCSMYDRKTGLIKDGAMR